MSMSDERACDVETMQHKQKVILCLSYPHEPLLFTLKLVMMTRACVELTIIAGVDVQ